MAATTQPRRSVVLHFDLNRTVLMSDAAGGRTMENTVDYLLSECTWGYVHPHKPSEWVCVSEASSIEPPTSVPTVAVDGHDVPVKLITYKQFVDEAHPYKSLQGGADGTIEQIKAFNKAAKKQRTNLQSAFTGGDGPGSRVRTSFRDVMAKLHFPEGAQRDAAKQLASTLSESRLQEAYSEGKYYLLPSFMRFLAFLGNSSAATDNFDFKLVFRTFGDDIPEVAKEIELLVDGLHPFLSTASSGGKLPPHFKLDVSSESAHVGTFYRDGYGADGTALAVGTLTKLPFSSANQDDPSALAKFYASGSSANTNVDIVRGFSAIQSKITDMLRSSSTLALRDYWEWWSAHAENGDYGKLLLVDDSRAAQNDDIVIFFDDHIEAHHAHIVDVRDVATGAPVAFETSKRKYLQRVEPFAAITDADYFITLVQKILADHESKLRTALAIKSLVKEALVSCRAMGSGASMAQEDGTKRVLAVFVCHSSQESELRRRISSSTSAFAELKLSEDDVVVVTESFPKDQQTQAELLTMAQVAVLAVDPSFQHSAGLIATVSFLKDNRFKVVGGPLTFHSRPSGALGAICFAFGVWEPRLFCNTGIFGSTSTGILLEATLTDWGFGADDLAFLSKTEAQVLLEARAGAEQDTDEVIAEDSAILEAATGSGETEGGPLSLYVFTGEDGERIASTFAALPGADTSGAVPAMQTQLRASRDVSEDLAALAQAQVASFVITDASLTSPAYRRLFEAAVRWQKPILPINAATSRLSGWLAMAMAGKLWYQVDLASDLEQVIHTKYSEIPDCACKVDDSCLATDYLQCLSGLVDAPPVSLTSQDDREAAIIQHCGEKAQVMGGVSTDRVHAVCTSIQALVAAFEDDLGFDPEACAGLEALGVAMDLPGLEQHRRERVMIEEIRSCSVAPHDLLPKPQANPELKLANIHYQVTRMSFNKIPSVLDARGVPLPGLQLDAMFSYQWGAQRTVLDVHQQGQVHNLRAWFDVFGHMQGNVNAAMATAVENVACVVVFLTRSYVASINCRLEFQYAASHSKPMVFVFLEDPAELAKALPNWITDVAGTTEFNVYPSLLREASSSGSGSSASNVLALDFTCDELHGVSMTTALFSAIRQLAAARHRGKPRIAYDGSLFLYATTSALRHAVSPSEAPGPEPGHHQSCTRCGVAYRPEVATSLEGCRDHSGYYVGGSLIAGRWVCCEELCQDGPGCRPAQHLSEPLTWVQDPDYGTYTWKFVAPVAAPVPQTCSRCGVTFLHEVASSLEGCRKHSAYYVGGSLIAGRWVCCEETQKDGAGCQPTQHIAGPRVWTQDPSYGTLSWKPE